jgi:formate dehydrogenase major subunit
MHPLDLERSASSRRHADHRVAPRRDLALRARRRRHAARRGVRAVLLLRGGANMLTNPVLDPFGKIPEFKYCAVKVTAGGTHAEKLSCSARAMLPPRPPARRHE